MEQRYTDSHEAPYEGNFSDHFNKPLAMVSASKLEKAASAAIRKQFIEKYRIDYHREWILPLLVTYLGNMRKYKLDNGKYSGLQFRNKNFTSLRDRGIYRFLMVNERSSYLKSQYNSADKQYCSLVPLILYAQKLVDQTDYSAWDRDELIYVVNSELADAMLCDVPEFSKEELLRVRTAGLTEVSGKMKNPVSTHMLYGMEQKSGDWAGVPKLAKVMLTQIWCAHPENRTRYMVLNPSNWDRMPLPLVQTTVVEETPSVLERLSDSW
jgi:hypothetical protein